jgi:hypothetical protein
MNKPNRIHKTKFAWWLLVEPNNQFVVVITPVWEYIMPAHVLWAHHEKSPEVDERDGRVTMRMRSMLLLNTTLLSIQTDFKSITCCVFVHVTSDW